MKINENQLRQAIRASLKEQAKKRNMNESVDRVVKNAIRRVLNEVKIDYGRDSYSSDEYEWDSNPRNDRGFNYNRSLEFSNEIKEDYVALAQRLEKLTKTEWSISPSSSYSSSHNRSGYDSYSESSSDWIVFSTPYKNLNRVQTAKVVDLVEKVIRNFFKYEKKQSYYDPEQKKLAYKKVPASNDVDVTFEKGYIVATVYNDNGYGDNTIKGHDHSRVMTYGKDYAGYPKPKDSEVSGYNHPYPNSSNDGGNYELANWERFQNGQAPMTYDQWSGRGNDRRRTADEEPEDWFERFDRGDFDEY